MLQFRRNRQARAKLTGIFERPEHALVVHYSCESFANRPQGRSPRVTSIAVRFLASGKTSSFSIHQVAEREHVPYDTIDQQYDALERKMLDEFYDFVSRHSNMTWLHWSMRDVKFGFPALEHRHKVLGGAPVSIPEERLVDLSRLFVALYGNSYAGHPRMETIVKLNSITTMDMLSGAGEAAAFEAKEYFRLHESTLRKVDNLANLAERAVARTLKTNSTWRQRNGVSAHELITAAQNNWVVVALVLVVGVAGSLFTIFGISLRDCGGSLQSAPRPVAGESAAKTERSP